MIEKKLDQILVNQITIMEHMAYMRTGITGLLKLNGFVDKERTVNGLIEGAKNTVDLLKGGS